MATTGAVIDGLVVHPTPEPGMERGPMRTALEAVGGAVPLPPHEIARRAYRSVNPSPTPHPAYGSGCPVDTGRPPPALLAFDTGRPPPPAHLTRVLPAGRRGAGAVH